MSYSRLLILLSLVVCGFFGCGRLDFDSQDGGSSSEMDSSTDSTIPASCVDGVMNQDETEVDCGGSCPPCVTITSCKDLLAAMPGTASGVQRIDPDGNGPIAPSFAYCEMVADGGGWTLAAKIDGSQMTFLYNDPIWTNTTTLNETSTNMDKMEAKFSVFSDLAFDEVRVGMEENNQLKWLILPHNATSLRSVFQTGTFVSIISVGRTAWRDLINNDFLQTNCNQRGFNTTSGGIGLRIGILANNEPDCGTPDSWIGFGYTGFVPGCAEFTITSTTGNVSSCTQGIAADQRNIAAFGYVMVR